MNKLTIIGAGLGDLAYLTDEARFFIANHKNIYTSESRFENLKEINPRIKIVPYGKLEEVISESKKDIAIVVSGDYGFYSIAKTMMRIFENKELELINGLSSMQYFASRIGKVYQDWAHLSLHASNKNKLIGTITHNQSTFLLTGGKNKPADICHELLKAGFKNLDVFVGENLGCEDENIVQGSLDDICELEFSDINVMLILNDNFADKTEVLTEAQFIKAKQPIKNDIVRFAIANKLQIKPTDIVYNIGAGAGELSVELSKKANLGLVYAFEKEESLLETMVKNKLKHRAYNIINIKSFAPYFDQDFYKEMNFLTPGKALINTTSEKLKEIMDWIIDLNPDCKIAVTTSSIDGLSNAISCYKCFNIEPEIECINISTNVFKNKNTLVARAPIYLLVGQVPLDDVENE